MPELSVQLLLAHSSHWALWVLYSAPVVAVVVALVLSSIRARRLDGVERSEEDPDDSAQEPDG
jgi:cytochrome c-type biogenesis protein CcmH/NrfF